MTLTDKTLEEASINPDGKTYNGLTVMRWLHEATTGKQLSEEDARALAEEARARSEAKRK